MWIPVSTFDMADDQDHELYYWSDKLGVSRDKLRETVARVGPMRQAVERGFVADA